MTLATIQWFWQRPGWHWAYVWATFFLLLPTLLALLAWFVSATAFPRTVHPRPFVDFISGVDGRWSTSKSGVLLWTGAVWFAFLAILFETHGDGLQHAVLRGEYLVVLGIPAAAALAAKGITTQKVTSGAVSTKAEKPGHSDLIAGVGELVSNDQQRGDLLDFQYFGFNLILLGFFFLQFFGHPAAGLPVLPDTLLALSGVSAASYVGKKGLSDGSTGPTIRSVVPPKQSIGQNIRILGTNFATVAEPTVTVTIGGVEAPAPTVVIKDTVTEITAIVPENVPQGQTDVVVVAFDGRSSAPYAFEVI
jgi:hypothetical protein